MAECSPWCFFHSRNTDATPRYVGLTGRKPSKELTPLTGLNP
jgi:hypothetical protein